MFQFLELDFLLPLILVVSSAILVVLSLRVQSKKKRNLPPGPPCWPVLGTILSHKAVLKPEEFCQLAEKYGDVFMLKTLSHRLLVLNSYEAIKEATITKPYDFADRRLGHGFMSMSVNPNIGGLLVRDFDDKGKKVRKLSIAIMRSLGVGRSVMEEVISEEAHALANAFTSTNGKSFDCSQDVASSVTNILLHIMLNNRSDSDDGNRQQILHDVNDFIHEMRLFHLFNPFPFLRFLPPFKSIFKTFVNANHSMVDYMWRHTKQAKSSFHPGQDSNFVEAYFDKHYNAKHDTIDINEDELKFLLRDFLLAGTETSTTSLKWTLLYLTNNPDVQQKLQAELDRVVGRDRSYRLRDKVPYLDAVIWEVQRHGSIVPMGVPHAVSAETDAELQGYVIPKDSMLLFNIYAVHHNKTTWGDPENFRPERFLDSDGEFVKHPHVMPFSIGKRACVGELLARQELYLFTAILIQRFSFLPVEGASSIDSTPDVAFTRLPKSYQLRAIPRY